jgi:hypothetical protein
MLRVINTGAVVAAQVAENLPDFIVAPGGCYEQ